VSRFDRILNTPAVPGNPPLDAAGGRIENVPLDASSREKYWNAVLTNAYFLLYPGPDGRYESMKPLYDILENLKCLGAGLAIVEEVTGRGKIRRLKLERGSVPESEWNRIRVEQLPRYKDRLRWLFTLSVMGAAAEYTDLAAELPPEWVDDVLGKHGARIAELRRAVIEEMIEREAESGKPSRGLYFEIEDGRVYCLVPYKTGRRTAGNRVITELTPEEAVIVAEAQEAGLLPAGVESARSALKWGSGAA